MGRSIEQENSFLQVLLKLIPSELIAVFVFVQGVMPRLFWAHVAVVVVLVALTPLYLRRASGVRSRAQLVISTVSLVVWIYAMGAGPFRFIRPPFYEPWYGAVILAVWTLVPPMFLAPGAGLRHTAPSERSVPVGKTTARPAAARSAPVRPYAEAPRSVEAIRWRASERIDRGQARLIRCIPSPPRPNPRPSSSQTPAWRRRSSRMRASLWPSARKSRSAR